MSSLLTEMRPAPSEKVERRHGARKYQPDYNLYKHVKIPTPEEARDPKPAPFSLRTDRVGTDHVYTTRHGRLHGDLMDQFARHYQWKTNSQLNYVPHLPPNRPAPDKGKETYLPRSDMMRVAWAGRRDTDGPFEYQKVIATGGELPEDKVWPMVHKQYVPFPHNAGSRTDLFREVRHNIGGRTAEETETVKNHIRDLVKQKTLNTQFVKPMTHFKGIQNEVRVYEGLERPAGRNPVNMTTEHMAQFGRYIPSKEYQRPEFCAVKPLSKTVVLQRPFNHFNKIDHPHSLDYLPMPWNYTKNATDTRLIDGYEL